MNVSLNLTGDELTRLIRDAVRAELTPRDDEVLKAREAAAHLKISEKTLSRKVKDGEIVPLPGKPLRFLRSELERIRRK